MATKHTYKTGTYNGVTLHVINTAASNIKLLNLRAVGNKQMMTLKNSSYYGVNGAWYNMSTNLAILNIAMQDGKPVGPGTDEGKTNSVGKGYVFWNGTSVGAGASVTNASDIGVTGTGTWIQGGIALWLGFNQWEAQVRAQGEGAANYLTGNGGRTALIGHINRNEVDLFVTTDSITVAKFRGAIQAYYGISDAAQANNSLQGVMLDGGLSSQMKAKNSANSTIYVQKSDSGGNYRALPQLVTLKVTT